MPLSADVQYTLNERPAELQAGSGIYSKAKSPDSQIDMVDVTQCQTFSQFICHTWTHQYVVGIFDYFADKNTVVPWGSPCCRIEGGPSTCRSMGGNETGTCEVGVPDITLTVKSSIIDEERNMVVLIVRLCESDTHMFRFEPDINPDFGYGIRYIMTLTTGCTF